MPKKEEIKKVFTQILEPFALGLLALFFILPIITVMNLTPITRQIKKLDVLGVTTQDEIIVRLIGGKHDIFSGESLNKLEDFKYSYSVRLGKRGADSYSKPILEIENRSNIDKIVTLWGQTLSNTRSEIYLIVNEDIYRLQDNLGDTYEQEIRVPSNDKTIVFLALENLSGVQFSEIFDMTITVK
jgi:hypothetical protein